MKTVIIRPLITETSLLEAQDGVFTFEVDRFATKYMVKHAVEDIYKVHVVSIATSIRKGKTKRVGKARAEKALPKVKKARVSLKKGEKIEYFEVKQS